MTADTERAVPDPVADIAATAAEGAEAVATMRRLHGAGQALDVFEVRTAAAVAEAATYTARDLAVQYIREGRMSRVQAAGLLRVHQATVARWVRDGVPRPAPEPL